MSSPTFTGTIVYDQNGPIVKDVKCKLLSQLKARLEEKRDGAIPTAVHWTASYSGGYAAGMRDGMKRAIAEIDKELAKL